MAYDTFLDQVPIVFSPKFELKIITPVHFRAAISLLFCYSLWNVTNGGCITFYVV